MEAALVYKDFHSSLRDFRNKGSLFKKPYEKTKLERFYPKMSKSKDGDCNPYFLNLMII